MASNYGPVNYGNQGSDSPFGGLDNRINYNNMVKHQMVSQYANGVLPPSSLPLQQQRSIATDPRFQYGVDGGQDPRFYERQAQLSRHSFSSAITKTAVSLSMFGAAETAASAMGATSIFAPLSMGLMAGVGIPAYFIGQGFKRNLQRQKYMASLSSDVEQYRDQLGFTGGLSYSQGTQLGRNLQESMYKPGFFNKEQKMEIHKMGLSNNLISAKGAGGVGNIQQYQKNVEDLISTTADIVKLLNTTKEGGMSVIKELQKSGFGSMSQIKQQVQMAKAAGGFTGMGAQNMMSLGNAGARAVQGTPWSASVGASSYQMGAVQAQLMSSGSSAGAYAVRRAGGVAAAGAAIGNFQMNVLQSGIGTKLAAFSMNADGSVNKKKMERMLSGNASAFEIVSGANSTGYAMGENKVRLDMYKEDMWNQMSEVDRMRATMSGFDAWSSQRPYSSLENKAAKYAGMFTNNSRDKRLMYENLRSSKDLSGLHARAGVNNAMLNQSMGSPVGIPKAWKGFTTGFNRGMDSWTGAMANQVGIRVDAIGEVFGNIGKTIYNNTGSLFGRKRGKIGDLKTGLDNIYGINESEMTGRARIFAPNTSGSSIYATNTGFTGKGILETLKTVDNIKAFQSDIASAIGNNNPGELLNNTLFKSLMNDKNREAISRNPPGAVIEMVRSINKHYDTVSKNFETVTSNYDLKGKDIQTSEGRARHKAFGNTMSALAANGVFVTSSNLEKGSYSKNEDGKYIVGTKGASEAEKALILASQNKAKTDSIDRQTLGQVAAAAGVNVSAKFDTKIFSMFTKDMKKQYINAGYKNPEQFVNAMYDESSIGTTTPVALALATKIGLKRGDIDTLLKEKERVLTARDSRSGAVRANSFMDDVDKDLKGRDALAAVMSNVYSIEPLSNADIKTLSGFKSTLKKNLVVSNDLLNKAFSDKGTTAEKSSRIKGLLDTNAKMKETTYLEQLQSDADKLDELMSKGSGSVKLQTVYGGSEAKLSMFGGNSREELATTRGELRSEIARKEDDLKKYQMPSTVRSPVLNYWNNRWTL